MAKKKKRYVQVGLGGRSMMFTNAIIDTHKKDCEMVGFCDNNPGRLRLRQRTIKERTGIEIPAYSDREFDKMIKTEKPDVVIVTTKDCFHDKYIVRAMELGCDAVTEKPMTTDEKKCQRIVDTQRKTGKNLRVTFNYRYSPPRSQVKELLQKGLIGNVLSVDFEWALNTSHGADYFRRWHREKKNSGGLMVHKATHHFDLINWWLAATPVEVYAMGKRGFYGNKSGMAEFYGLKGHAERCLKCKYMKNKKCKFALDLKKHEHMRNLYMNNEKYDKYYRDRCVFGSTMDIEDSMNVVVRYNTGALMSYCLNAFLPWEGYRVSFNGTLGRLEHTCVESVYISGDNRIQGETIPQGTTIIHYPHRKNAKSIKVRTARGGHGGGDAPLLADVLSSKKKKDPLKRSAGVGDGARSILTGIAANKAMKTNKPIDVTKLVKNMPKASWE